MNIQPLLDAPLAVQIHVATVIPAALLGPYIFLGRKGTPRHKLLGRLWLSLMVVTALSSFFIHSIRLWGDFSPIHILSAVVIVSSFLAIYHARTGNIRAHKSTLISTYIGGIFGAGVFTFWPGRLMSKVFLGGEALATPGSVEQSIVAVGVVVAIGYIYAMYVTRSRPGGRRRRNAASEA
jgi:uncharacterized membrane protein